MVKKKKIWVTSMVSRAEDADELMEEFAAETGMSHKAYLRMRLLVEETMGMARTMLRNFQGELWLEGEDPGYKIILEADVREHKDNALPAAGSPTGFMAKIAEMLNCSYVFDDTSELPGNFSKMLPDYIRFGMVDTDDPHVWVGRWSLTSYRHSLKEHDRNPGTEPKLDELEKSIVASIADDVTVGIYGRKIRLAIYKM